MEIMGAILTNVTLHVSVWVEIYKTYDSESEPSVTLHVSVWVEIYKYDASYFNDTSHAPRERVSWNSCINLTNF